MSNPTVLITGSAKRIGRAIAFAFARRGCDIALHYNHSQSNAESVATEIRKQFSVNCERFGLDLLAPDSPKQLISQCVEKFHRLDYLINNASIFFPTPVNSATQDQLNDFLKVNCHVPLMLAKEAFPYLKSQQGAVVNLVDIYAEAGLTEHTFYVASKSALLGLNKELALEFAPHVRVNAVSPGAILWPDSGIQGDTPNEDSQQKKILELTALKRLGTPESIAATVIYLAIDAHYSTGALINVDGGRRDYI